MSSHLSYARLASAMRKAVKRKANESDSEDSVDMVTNRGNKLRKKARYVHEGKLAPPNGPEVYKRNITHAGFQREIISRLPTLYDDDGFEIDSDEDDEGAQAAAAAAADFYPYSEIRIESLLAPLTRPGDLPNHPTLSRPFTSKPLTDLTRQAREMVQKEKAALWRMKQLLTLMSGDHTWIPCQMLETETDINLFDNGNNGYRDHLLEKNRLNDHQEIGLAPSDGSLEEKTMPATSLALENGTQMQAPGDVAEKAMPDVLPTVEDAAMIDPSNEPPVNILPNATNTLNSVPTEALIEVDPKVGKDTATSTDQRDGDAEGAVKSIEGATGGESELAEVAPEIKADERSDVPQVGPDVENREKAVEETHIAEPDEEEATQDPEDVPEPRRMRTRAQAQAASDNNTTVSRARSNTPSTNSSYIHPYFIAPPSAHPTSDMGLPPVEAEETRRLLQLYIQKQEEVCRGSQKIYDGLMRAERLRKIVFKWAKADGHVGEMSDGEDWYDKEEWGLTEDLKKGQDEEEEDAATTAKKTRTRRQ